MTYNPAYRAETGEHWKDVPDTLTPHKIIMRALGRALEAAGAYSAFSQKGLPVLARYITTKVELPLNFKFYSERVAQKVADLCGNKYSVAAVYNPLLKTCYWRIKYKYEKKLKW